MAQLKNSTVENRLKIPTGTDQDRPNSPQNGMIRFNNSKGNAEVFKSNNFVNSDSGLDPQLGFDQTNPAPSAKYIKQATGTNTNGLYWIDVPNLGARQLYCIMDTRADGGGWMGVTSEISPKIDNENSDATWQNNSDNRMESQNPEIIDAFVNETGCGGSSYYELQSPSVVGIDYSEIMMLMQRISTLGQCSTLARGSATSSNNVYYIGPEYQGPGSLDRGMCTWSDFVFVGSNNNDGRFQNGESATPNLKPYWRMIAKGDLNLPLEYSVRCASGEGQHYHMWFVR